MKLINTRRRSLYERKRRKIPVKIAVEPNSVYCPSQGTNSVESRAPKKNAKIINVNSPAFLKAA